MADGDNWKVSGRGRGWLHSVTTEERKPLRRPHNDSIKSDHIQNTSPGQPQIPTWSGPVWKKNGANPVASAMSAMSINETQPNSQPNYAHNISEPPTDFQSNSSPSLKQPTLDIQPNSSQTFKQPTLEFKPNSSESIKQTALDFQPNSFQSIRKTTPDLQPLSSESVAPNTPDSNSFQSLSIQESIGLTSTLSPLAAPFVPRNLLTQDPLSELDASLSTEEEIFDEEPYIIQQVRNIVSILTVSPGKFDVLVPALAAEINSYVDDEYTLSCIAEIIFEEAVNVPNIRYNGARICDVFSKKVNIQTSEKTFRHIILQRCQRENLAKAEFMANTITMERLRGFVLFMGELFVNMEIMINGTSQKLAPVGKALIELLGTLLSQPNTDNVKCVGHLLKFAGAQLDDYEMNKSRSTPQMDKIFNSLKDYTLSQDIHRAVREMLMRVMELRASDWGRSASSPVVRSDPTICDFTMARAPVTDGAVRYGPDGMPLTVEEALFLEASGGMFENEEEDEYDYQQQDGNWSTTTSEMDEEMEAAYEDFLRESGQ